MGQCMSRKAAGAFAASAAATHQRPTKMPKHNKHMSPDDENNKDNNSKHVPQSSSSIPTIQKSKGASISFGFKHRPNTAPSIAANSSAARRLANNTDNIDKNGNGESDTDPLTSNVVPTGRTTPRLMPPKKEAVTTRINRFGFRQPQINRMNKVADLNAHHADVEIVNNNFVKTKVCQQQQEPITVRAVEIDSNKNKKFGFHPVQAEKFTLQSSQLPRPIPPKLIETKTAKTLLNTSRKNAAYHDDNWSKDGSLTEDSGVGSGGAADIEHLSSSPTYGIRRESIKPRNLEMVVSGNTFDVRDLEEASYNSTPPLPQLPSAFASSTENKRGYLNSGYVRERTLEYQRNVDTYNQRKISITSSEGFSDGFSDYGENEKTFKEKYRSEKLFLKPAAHKTFLKARSLETNNDSSPPSSDEHEWTHGGEAMADEISFSITSSSDESKDNNNRQQMDISTKLQDLINLPISSVVTSPLTISKTEINVKNILLTIEDPKFAAVAAASNTTTLLEDETSPDSLVSYSESEIIKKKECRGASNSNSKDINEKLTPSSPGTPTNASNSLSLSDGKDDFLIDDEIADQPSLVFEDNINDFSSTHNNNNSDNLTLVDLTPKPKRRTLPAIEGSPLLRNKKFMQSSTVSLDTLSPCESIASDDLMMDFDYSQSSGLDDVERVEKHHNSGFLSLDETILARNEEKTIDNMGIKEWSGVLLKKTKSAPKTPRLLRSRTGTPNSIPDSPRSFDGGRTTAAAATATSTKSKPSPLRLSRAGLLSNGGYDSDDSIKLDRANQTAMKQDIMSIKTMLLKLRRVLNESETHIPFDGQITLANGFFNGCSSESLTTASTASNCDESKLELAELRRQVLFLQGQLEDKERTVQSLQEQMIKLTTENYISNSAPASTVASTIENTVCNAATQTERIRPISAGPSLLNGTSVDGSAGSLVSVSKSSSRKCHLNQTNESPSPVRRTQQSRLWRKPGEPPSPQRYTNNNNNNNSLSSSPSLLSSSSIPRRANSRSRTPSTPS